MRSPFPGMDPYLEDPGRWPGVHSALIAVMREVLNRDLGPDFIADGETTVYILSPDERRRIQPDVYVVETPAAQPTSRRRGASAITAPLRVPVAALETYRQPSIVIRDRASQVVVTILEVLSPINKLPLPTVPAGGARAEFERKRRAVMASGTNWIELDLLRAGEPLPDVPRLSDNLALLLRVGSSDFEVWAFGVRDPLPTIAVPLRAPEEDVPLNLQAVLDTVFTRYRYAELLTYHGPPPPPPFPPEDARWIASQVHRWRDGLPPPADGA